MMYFIAILVIFVTILYLFLSQNILVMVWQYGLRRFERICLPTRLILIRHGESEGNINHQIYRTVPDSSLRMTEKGKMQLKSTGKALHDLLGNKASIVSKNRYQGDWYMSLAEVILMVTKSAA